MIEDEEWTTCFRLGRSNYPVPVMNASDTKEIYVCLNWFYGHATKTKRMVKKSSEITFVLTNLLILAGNDQ